MYVSAYKITIKSGNLVSNVCLGTALYLQSLEMMTALGWYVWHESALTLACRHPSLQSTALTAVITLRSRVTVGSWTAKPRCGRGLCITQINAFHLSLLSLLDTVKS